MNHIQPRIVANRDEKYMGLAFIASGFSKDPNTQIGAFIVHLDGTPLGWGYNGPPKNINDNKVIWSRPEKYDYIIHAEQNAINHSCGDLKNSILYVTAYPCKNCMLNIINKQIMEVVYYPYFSSDESSLISKIDEKSKELADLGSVRIRKFEGSLNWVKEHVNKLDLMGIFK